MNKTVTMGPNDTNYKGDNWYYKYRTTGHVQFEEMQVSRADVRSGDLMCGEIEYDGWAHVDRVSTTANRHPWTGEASPARTRINFGGMSWTSQLSSDTVTVRRPVR